MEAPFDAPAGIVARTVKVYLDTSLVPGWNEIDAVELIGRDGSRQWARTASATSSFGDRARETNLGAAPRFVPGRYEGTIRIPLVETR